MMTRIIRTLLGCIFIVGIAAGLVTMARAAPDTDVDPPAKWGWSTNAGWIDFDPPDGGVTVCVDHLEGYAWGENVGWIRLGTANGCGTHTYSNTSPTDYGVNRDGTALTGYAWGTNVGWINFDPPDGGVQVDPATGAFSGYAWGENVGWIKMGYAAPGSNIDPAAKWAWSTNAGWINFNPPVRGIRVCADHLEGYAWGENVGWIRLGTATGCGTHTYSNASAADYGVNRARDGTLTGYAWGTNVGWINFDPPDGGVQVDPATGTFSGYAWGETIGWIKFSSAAPVPYRVAMLLRRVYLPLVMNGT
jgi:hypothetical protein